jgi:hypothetical protein
MRYMDGAMRDITDSVNTLPRVWGTRCRECGGTLLLHVVLLLGGVLWRVWGTALLRVHQG